MITVDAYPDAELLTAARVTADRDAWLANKPVVSYAITIGKITLDPEIRAQVDGFTAELEVIGAANILETPSEGVMRNILRRTRLTPESYQGIIVEPFRAFTDLALAYARRCDAGAEPSPYASNVALGLHRGEEGGYHTDRYEGESSDDPVVLRFVLFWGDGGPTRFGIGARQRDQMRNTAELEGSPAENGLKVATFDEGEVVCFAGAHGIHAASELTGSRLFLSTSIALPAIR